MKCDYCGKEIKNGKQLYDDPFKIYPFCSQECIAAHREETEYAISFIEFPFLLDKETKPKDEEEENDDDDKL